ncbi:hypothetical protein SIRV1gp22 [Sulfolobus islandicus rod-shaped virus 1]|uniref:Uncharacterized protein 64 n=1 Tax=Sulfolobus islandicus rod-shaped virus 1 TaxID=157898 RepID=Y64_SIRV1|nr:hypothetical protein SIRV1gp22 [Sulfolobus islandicus rod-shaped virus 1]Q8QL33.1 RecName: Full=Uncharacterized protein 64 [Sulfolobus islandicus rod-shaped virus 1]CAC93977.1 hypothetical protein [Sulfolobus islandicus rod-shaped virus 1]CAG38841.1 hypothetical protein [Sulfolobus islandicus rudivirus 1 variant XX]
MITYYYDEKNKELHIKIYILIDQVPNKPTEEELKKVLPKILKDYANMIENGKMKLIDSKEWGIW